MAKYIDVSKVTIPKGLFNDLNVPKLLDWLNSQPAADVVSKETHEACVKALQALAETDVVQIVRCKNCLNWVGNAGRFVDNLTGHCFLLDLTTINSDYCSYGIRRADDENL